MLTYNDLLHDHARACLAVGREMGVPVLDMHKLAMEEIEELGRDASIPYYHVDDWTHTNDYGAVRAAGYAAKELQQMDTAYAEYRPLADAVNAVRDPWIPVPAPLRQKPARLKDIQDPYAVDSGEAAKDHQAEKDGGDSLTRLLDAVKTPQF